MPVSIATTGDGDLMGDLKSRLANLRKGISAGKMGNDDVAASSRPAASGFANVAMSNVSNMIPHAPAAAAADTVDDEDEWED